MDEQKLKDALFHLTEECCELGKAASKMYRFGPDHVKKKGGPTNTEKLISEFNDVVDKFDEVLKVLGDES